LNTLTYFTVFGYWDLVDDAFPGGTSSDPKVSNFTAFVNFHPRLPQDLLLYVPQLSDPDGPEDTAVELATITGRIVTGNLCTINKADTVGVRLVAATPIILTALQEQGFDDLVYDVEFTGVNMNGKPHPIRPFGFSASRSDSPITITSPSLQRLPYGGPGSGYIFQ
jgi:hypothetical protein